MSKELEQAKVEYCRAVIYDNPDDAFSYAVDYIEELEREIDKLNAGLNIALQLHHEAKQETKEVRKEVDSYTVARVEELRKIPSKVYIAYDDGTLVGVFKTVSDAQSACISFAAVKNQEMGKYSEIFSQTPWKQEVESHEYPIERFICSKEIHWEQWIDEHAVEENF